MRRLVAWVLSAYLVIALASKVLERRGALLCGCSEYCWCKRPGLSVFRWVFPRWHRGPTADQTHTHT